MVASIQLFRMIKIVEEIRRNQFPDVNRLHEMLCKVQGYENVRCVCSCRTIMRDIRQLREVFGAPIHFNDEYKGYYLSDRKWQPNFMSSSFKLLHGFIDETNEAPKKPDADNDLVILRVPDEVAKCFQLNCFDKNAEVTSSDESSYIIRIRSMSDSDVIQFVLGKAGKVELISPARLRAEIASIARQIAEEHLKEDYLK